MLPRLIGFLGVLILLAHAEAAPAAAPVTSTIYSFEGNDQGAVPEGGVTLDRQGRLLVSTDRGGTNDSGAVYRLTRPNMANQAWHAEALHRFTGGSGGGYPLYLLLGDDDDILGVALDGGGPGFGMVFRLAAPIAAADPWRFASLHAFRGAPDGAEPSGALARAPNGILYGTTSQGGGGGCLDPFGDLVNCGTVYALTPPIAPATIWRETVVHRFSTGHDGYTPVGRLLPTASGALYGATTVGGSGCQGFGNGGGCGVIFELAPPAAPGGAWLEHAIYRFKGGPDGEIPTGSLIADAAGALYGTTSFGGIFPGFNGDGFGTVFKLTPPAGGKGRWTFATLYRFKGADDGFEPQAGLWRRSDGTLYGTTELGGPNHLGTVYSLAPAAGGKWRHAVLHGFGSGGDDGAYPEDSLSANAVGDLFGVTWQGGGYGFGTVFMVAPAGR